MRFIRSFTHKFAENLKKKLKFIILTKKKTLIYLLLRIVQEFIRNQLVCACVNLFLFFVLFSCQLPETLETTTFSSEFFCCWSKACHISSFFSVFTLYSALLFNLILFRPHSHTLFFWYTLDCLFYYQCVFAFVLVDQARLSCHKALTSFLIYFHFHFDTFVLQYNIYVHV